MPIDLEDFETRVIVRQLELADFDAVVALQLACFPKMQPWEPTQFASQIERFPQGQVGIEIDEQLVATASCLIVDESDYSAWNDWSRISANGTIENHDPDGDTLYGIEIQVHPEFRGMRLARRLYEARKQLCRECNLARILIGGRIPGYAAHKDKMSAPVYVEAVMARRFIDPVLTTQLANGFVLKQLVPDYLPSDEDSSGYATMLEWSNLEYVPRSTTARARQRTDRVRVSTVQYPMRAIHSFDEFAQQVRFYVDTASDYNADFLLFPELFTLQLLSLTKGSQPGEAARVLAGFTPDYLDLCHDLAVKYNVNIIGGSQFEIQDDGKLLNVAYLFRRDGSLARQPKLHVTPSESRWWGVQGGDTLEAFDTDRGPIGILICYDVQFPELARVLANDGARLLFVPYNTNDRYGHNRVTLCARARCVENHLFAVTAGCVGALPGVENADIHAAQSGVYTPSDVTFARDGIAALASENVEQILVQDVDLDAARRHMRSGTVKNLADRRTDLFQVHFKGRLV